MKNTIKSTSDIKTRYRTFEVKYFGPTNTRGSKVKITDLRQNISIFIPYNHEMRDAQEMALSYLLSKSISVDAMALTKNDAFLLSRDFSTPLK